MRKAVRKMGDDKICGLQDAIDAHAIGRYINTVFVGKNVHYEEKLDSTNDVAKRLAENGAENGTVIITECQTKGKGRSGKTWVSPPGVNCYLSILLRPEINASNASMITLVTALAAAEAIKECCGLDTFIKWPNDVVVNGKKLCGILTESSTDLERLKYVVVGIGINMNQMNFPDEIIKVASSVRLESGKEVVRAKLAGTFLNCFEILYKKFLETSDMSLLLDEYNSLLINCGRDVRIIEKESECVVKALGIDETGALLVKNENGDIKKVISGEVSVRGVYGYT